MSKFKLKPGVVFGGQLQDIFDYCKEAQCALPAVNVIGSSSTAGALHAAKETSAPIIIQFSNGGGHFNAGKFLDNSGEKAAIAGTIAGALQIHHLAKVYGVSVILHTDHAAKKLLPWVSGLIDYSEGYYKQLGTPLFSSHMLDLSEEPLDENLAISKEYLTRMAKLEMLLEVELGITGGEEDGVDNSSIDSSRLYTQPEDVLKAYDILNPVGLFSVAAAFGNTHGVYKPGNVVLTPEILANSQKLLRKERNTKPKELNLVFHGGSGSEKAKIKEAVSYGVVKFNIDTDTQWAFTEPVRAYIDANHQHLMSQIGVVGGDQDAPNKKYIDPRAWLHAGEKGLSARLVTAFNDLNCQGKFEY